MLRLSLAFAHYSCDGSHSWSRGLGAVRGSVAGPVTSRYFEDLISEYPLVVALERRRTVGFREPVVVLIWIYRHLHEEAIMIIRFTGTYLGLYGPLSGRQFNQCVFRYRDA
jgi:hypothetical protein